LALSHDFICLYYYRQKGNVKKLLSLGEFAQGANADIFNPYATLRVWTGGLGTGILFRSELAFLVALQAVKADTPATNSTHA
jgi:hypothetical protein